MRRVTEIGVVRHSYCERLDDTRYLNQASSNEHTAGPGLPSRRPISVILSSGECGRVYRQPL